MPGAARAVHRDHVDSRNSPAKIRQAKGPAPRFSTSLCPVSILESAHYKSTANNERLAIASLFPRPTSSVMHTRADCATSFAPRDLRDRASKSPSSSDEHLKILMMIRYGVTRNRVEPAASPVMSA